MLNRQFLFFPVLLIVLVIVNYLYQQINITSKETLKISSNASSDKEHKAHKKYPPSVILWTTWRSGSTFVGELLHQAHPDTFYDYEALWPFGIKICRDNNIETQMARSYLNSLLQCNMNTHPNISRKLTSLGFYRKFNNILCTKCNCENKNIHTDCQNTNVISNICKGANYHVIKLLRLGLVWAHSMLSDPTLDIKIVYLVRDPRAVIRSRSLLGWCKKGEDCSDPAKVCDHILHDLADARKLRATYPDKFHFVRYEDLSLNVLGTVENLWKRLDFNFTKEHQEKIYKLTDHDGSNKVDGIIRESVKHTFSWRFKMSYKFMQQVQDKCTEVLDILGLRSFHNIKDYKNYSIPILTKTSEDIKAWVG